MSSDSNTEEPFFQALTPREVAEGMGIGRTVHEQRPDSPMNAKVLSFRNVAPHTITIPGRVDIAQWYDRTAPARRWVVDGLLPEGNVTKLDGDGGRGKSTLALQLIAACALGKDFLGLPARLCRSVGVFCEDEEDELWRRVEAITRHYGAKASDLLEYVDFYSRVGWDNLLMQWPRQYEAGEVTDFFVRLQNLAVDQGAQLVVFDSLHDVFGGDENRRAHARQFVSELRALAMHIRGAVLFTAHPSLTGRNTGTGESGSTAWTNAVRSRLYITSRKSSDDGGDADDDGYCELRTMKSNYGPPGGKIRLRWEDGVFVVKEPSNGIVAAIERRTAEQALLEGIATFAAQGVTLSHNKTAPNYAPRIIAKSKYGGGNSGGELERMMMRLIEDGRLKAVEEGPPSRRRTHLEVVRDESREKVEP